MSRRALITGITGQDGALLAGLLLGRGYEVAGLVRPNGPVDRSRLERLGIAGRVSLRAVDLCDPAGLAEALAAVAPQEIYNFAAQSSVARSFAEAAPTFALNALAVVHLLEATRAVAPGARFYQASSSEMFGNADRLPITEASPLRPVSPYGIAKAAAHQVAGLYRRAHGMFIACGILFNHESVLRPPHFVTKKILAAAVRIAAGSGERLALGDLSIRRDWGYAPAYVEAMAAMLQQDLPDDFVICSGAAHSLEEFVAESFAAVGLDWRRHVDLDPALRRPSEIAVTYGDAGRARHRLGWDYQMRFQALIRRLVEDERAEQGRG
ncbi:MAG: GDP-mannose 4,6-dehydratase [Dongiaceae bacterium]